MSGSGGVRSFNGKVVIRSQVGIPSNGFNMPFSTDLVYDSQGNGGSVGFGKNWLSSGPLGGLVISGGQVLYREGPNQIKVFIPTTGGNYTAMYFVRDRLFYNSTTTQYLLTTPSGEVKTFDNSGRLIAFQDAGGQSGTVGYSGSKLSYVTVVNSPDSYRYDYNWGGTDLVQDIIYSVNGRAARKVVYGYEAGQLRTIKLYTNSSTGATPDWGTATQTVAAQVFSYHTSGRKLLRHVVTPEGYRQMVVNGISDPGAVAPAQLNSYAETEYDYDSSHRVTVMRTHGRKDRFGFTYTPRVAPNASLNTWTNKTRVERPGGSVLTYYFNRAGQVMLTKVENKTSAPTKTWYPLYQYFEETTGRLLKSADAAAIQSVSEAANGLVTLRTTAGLVRVTAYDTQGRLSYTGVKQGDGTSQPVHKLRELTYEDRSVSGLGTRSVIKTERIYRGEGSTLPAVTTYSYTWITGTFQYSKRTITQPVVTGAENGSGTAVVHRGALRPMGVSGQDGGRKGNRHHLYLRQGQGRADAEDRRPGGWRDEAEPDHELHAGRDGAHDLGVGTGA